MILRGMIFLLLMVGTFATFAMDELRMTDQDKEDFIRRTIHWKENGLDLEKQNCIILNFGADLVLSYPQIRLNLKEDVDLSPFSTTAVDPTDCTLVVVGGKFLKRFPEVLKKIDGQGFRPATDSRGADAPISHHMNRVPLAVFIIEDNSKYDINPDNLERFALTPAIVTVPRYKKYSSKGNEPATLITFNMVCFGLSQNTKNYQLTSYRDAIMGKPYSEICDNLAVKLIYEPWSIYRFDSMVFKDGKMDLPFHPVPRYLTLNQKSMDSELVQTFLEHCGITHVDIASYNWWDGGYDHLDYHFEVGAMSQAEDENKRRMDLLPCNHLPWFIFTKYPPLSSRLTNLLRIFDRVSWLLSFLSIFAVHNTFRLLCYIAKKMGYITLEEEILMWPFRVDIPVDSLDSDYIKSEKQRKHNNYLKIRKTAKRVFLVWCLGGGFIQWFFEALFFTMLLKPEFDPPVKSIDDFMARNMTLLLYPYSDWWKTEMEKSENPKYREFAKNHLTWELTWGDTFDVIRKKVLSDAGTHAYMTSIGDIQSWNDHRWYNTELNPVRPNPLAGWNAIRTFPLRENLNMVMNLYIQAGLAACPLPWENMEIGTDDYIEEFYAEGREDELLDPNHFQGLFLLMGCLISTGLVIALWELLNNESYKFVWLMVAGLFACFYVTCCNMFFFSTVLVNFDYEINRSLLESNKDVPMAILAFGTVTSVGFLFIAMIKTLALTYFDINEETNEDEDKGVKDESNVDEKKQVKKKPTTAILIMKKSMLIIFVSMIFFTICCLTYFGMFIFMKNQTTTVQNVTVKSEGPIRDMYSDILGEYRITDMEQNQRPVYKHLEADKFILFSSDGHWYLTKSKDDDEGDIKSLNTEQVFLPEVGWAYYDYGYFDRTNFDNCKTISGLNPNEPCVLPFKYWGVNYTLCHTAYQDQSGSFKEIEPWCPTEVDESGDAKKMIGWGLCGPGCPIASDAWLEDDATFIVEYSDVETWRMTAFLTMISTGSCLLIVGLLVSLLVTFFAKKKE